MPFAMGATPSCATGTCARWCIMGVASSSSHVRCILLVSQVSDDERRKLGDKINMLNGAQLGSCSAPTPHTHAPVLRSTAVGSLRLMRGPSTDVPRLWWCRQLIDLVKDECPKSYEKFSDEECEIDIDSLARRDFDRPDVPASCVYMCAPSPCLANHNAAMPFSPCPFCC